MYKKIHEAIEFDPAVGISDALQDWLQSELDNSFENENQMFSQWNAFQHAMRMPFTSPSNQEAESTRLQHSRLQQWSLIAEQYPDIMSDDDFLARQMLCAKMFISDTYRKQCLIEANDPEDYVERLKYKGPVSIDLGQTVAERLDEYGFESNQSGEDIYSPIPSGVLLSATLQTNDRSIEVAEEVHDKSLRDSGKEGSPAVYLLKETQAAWTRLLVDYIIFAAHKHDGSFSEVPFLQPKSQVDISRMDYPFKTSD
jgi:hypothetical protein